MFTGGANEIVSITDKNEMNKIIDTVIRRYDVQII